MFWYKLLLLTLQERIYAWLRYNWYVLCVPRDLWIWRREPGETKVASSLGQDDSPGHKVLEERCLVEKKESAAGDLGAGSFPLDKKEVPGIGCSREVPTEVLETGV